MKRTYSVIIPLWKNVEVAKSSILSVCSQWNPNNQFDLEIVLVDDVSDCQLLYKELIDKIQALYPTIEINYYINSKNTGQGLARQFGIDKCKGEYFFLLDYDDTFNIATIQRCDEQITKHIQETKKNDIACVSFPVIGYDKDDYTMHIPGNSIWVQSRCYNKQFLKDYNIRFTEETSRRGEDYTFMRKLDFAISHLPDYCNIQFPDVVQDARTGQPASNLLACCWWAPNYTSQTRQDKFWGIRISGATHIGSNQIAKYMIDFTDKYATKEEKGQWFEETKHFLLNATYSAFINIQKFIEAQCMAPDDFKATEEDWNSIRNAVLDLRKTLIDFCYDEVIPSDIIKAQYEVKNMSDIQYVEPFIDFNDFMKDPSDLDLDFESMKKYAATLVFDSADHEIHAPYVLAWQKRHASK